MIKEVIFFCYGDSSQAKTWSNVPFLFTKTLEDKGIKVHRIDLSPNYILDKIYSKIIFKFQEKFSSNTCSFRFTKFVKDLSYRRIKKAVEKFSSSDLCIFTSFDYYNKFSDIKTLLVCDWLYEVQLERLKRKPSKKEERFIVQQREALHNADCVVSLFPECAQRIHSQYPDVNVHYLDRYVINSFFEGELDSDKIIQSKIESKSILFVGTKKYLQAALKLIDAIKILQQKDPTISLNIIGMVDSDIDVELPANTKCYGYLQKDIKEQCDLYYKLLLETSVIVNVDPQWGGYSSIVEAMYFYTPILVAPYPDFVKEFGETIAFGAYNTEFNSNCIADNIERLLSSPDYSSLCSSAHERVSDYTWGKFVDTMFSIL